jgi:hypothetical protein
MTDPAEKGALPPFRLAMAAGTAALCAAIIYNAVAGQDGRQRDVLSRLSDLEQHETLPVTIGWAPSTAARPRRSAVTIEQLAALAANEGMQEAWHRPAARAGGSGLLPGSGRTVSMVRGCDRPSKPTSALTTWR